LGVNETTCLGLLGGHHQVLTEFKETKYCLSVYIISQNDSLDYRKRSMLCFI